MLCYFRHFLNRGIPRWRAEFQVKHIVRLAGIIGLSTMMHAQQTSEVPDKIKPPADEKLVLQVHATGVQVYACRAGQDGKFNWELKGPEADLHDQQGKVIGHHSAGPTWKHEDGSEVKAKAVVRVDSPDANAIPWLLLSATEHSGDGVLSKVTSIQRIHTQGGQPVGACDASHKDAETRSNYSADYYFYAASQ